MASQNIIFIIEIFNKSFFQKWKKLFVKINANNFNTIFASLKSNYKNEFVYKNYPLITFPNYSFIFKNFTKFFNYDDHGLNYLVDHPSFRAGIKKFLPKFLVRKYINLLYLYFRSNLSKYPSADIFVMEPKNFLYTPFIIIIEKICKDLNYKFTNIHISFLLDNVCFFNSLDRYSEKIVSKFNLLKKNNLNKNVNELFFINEFEKKYQIMVDKKSKYEDSEIKSFKINKNDKIALISLSKEYNYREFYFLENSQFNLKEIVKILKKNNYKIIIKKHPLTGKLKFTYDLPYYHGSLSTLNRSLNINLHISTASHSFFDAITFNIPILIYGVKDLYSMKTLMPEIFIENIHQLEKRLSSLHEYDYSVNYSSLKIALYEIVKNKNIKFNDLIDIDYMSNLIYEYYLNTDSS